jgi:hypothetical protein
MRWNTERQDIEKLFGNLKSVEFNKKGKFPTGSGFVIASKLDALRICDLHRSEVKNS